MRGDGVAHGSWSERVSLAADAVPFGFTMMDWHRGLRCVCNGRGVFAAVMGTAVYYAQSCGDYFYSGAGVCGDYFLFAIGRAAWLALRRGCRAGTGGDPCSGITRTARCAGVA